MPFYDNTRLWKASLSARKSDIFTAQRERLRVAYERMRDRVKPLAESIARDLPEFTIHDISHLDALWEYGDLVAGLDGPITPTEAFVLGGAFLIHDLGMGLAAFPNGLQAVKNEILWNDTMAALRRDNAAGLQQLPDNLLERRATAEVLRYLHARRAEDLAKATWKNAEGDQFHLIDDPELREAFAGLIGKLAHSHWWSVDRLATEFRVPIGAPGLLPAEWSVDGLRLACILRAADFAHLDDRRAPSFRRALQQPAGLSDDHWKFQAKLNRPMLDGDRLSYTAKAAFSLAESSAWWLCFDTLRGLNQELHEIDGLLTDLGKSRLAARGVANIDAPERLSTIIRTEGWQPVDARIRISAVAQLVSMLGGRELYGDSMRPPLRELMQNGTDAIRARRLSENRAGNWGTLKVIIGEDTFGKWIQVEDNGCGMSRTVITGPLLDFGTSFWRSEMMRRELPGLESKGFESTGRYGIGFFSVFMWGDRVHVTTQRFDAAKKDTFVLEFNDGLGQRPILRGAEPSEYIQDAGTRVRVWFRSPADADGLLSMYSDRFTLKELCEQVAPCSDVDIEVEQYGVGPTSAVKANDWITIPQAELIQRVGRKNVPDIGADLLSSVPVGELELLKDTSGRVYGRAAVYPDGWAYRSKNLTGGVVVVGGFQSCRLQHFAGVLVGDSVRASRDVAIPAVPDDVLERWLERQRDSMAKLEIPPEQSASVAQILREFGVSTGSCQFARSQSGWHDCTGIKAFASKHDSIYLVQDDVVDIIEREEGSITLNQNVLVMAAGRISCIASDSWRHSYGGFFRWPKQEYDANWGKESFHCRSLFGLATETIANAWGVSLFDVLKSSSFSGDEQAVMGKIGKHDAPVTVTLDIVRKPRGLRCR